MKLAVCERAKRRAASTWVSDRTRTAGSSDGSGRAVTVIVTVAGAVAGDDVPPGPLAV